MSNDQKILNQTLPSIHSATEELIKTLRYQARSATKEKALAFDHCVTIITTVVQMATAGTPYSDKRQR